MRQTLSTPPSQCPCGRPLFFLNSVCLACSRPAGFLPSTGAVHSLETADSPGLFTVDAPTPLPARRCANLDTPAACNWLIPDDLPGSLCLSCSLTRTIPNLSHPENADRWARIEAAKRTVLASLLRLQLPLEGLVFEFLESVLTGHRNGVITLNIAEADDAYRESLRTSLGEPYRTLTGHFRHELGHFYWDRLIAGSSLLSHFREVFGDEQADYAAALKSYHQNGPATGWEANFVSGYATAHPHEDWAETWAHYLHMREGLDTSDAVQLAAPESNAKLDPFTESALLPIPDACNQQFLDDLNRWCFLSIAVNELNRSMGQPDLYPFVLSEPVVRKLHLVHLAIANQTPNAKPPESSI